MREPVFAARFFSTRFENIVSGLKKERGVPEGASLAAAPARKINVRCQFPN